MPTTKPHPKTEDLPFIVTNKATVLFVIASIITLVSGAAWWQKIYNHPQRVFKEMIATNLSINSITRTTKTNSFGGVSEKIEQLNFVPTAATRSVVIITQGEGQNETQVKTETIGTRTQDFSQYLSIKTGQKGQNGKPLDYSSVTNQWGRSDSTLSVPEYYSQATLGLIPFANIKTGSVSSLVNTFNTSKVYQVDYSKVEPKRIDGKSALIFPVKVNLKEYLLAFQALAIQSGLGDYSSINPDDYADSPPVDILVTVDKLSRHLLELTYVGQEDQVERFSSHGLRLPVELPEKTIPIDQLQQKVQTVQ